LQSAKKNMITFTLLGFAFIAVYVLLKQASDANFEIYKEYNGECENQKKAAGATWDGICKIEIKLEQKVVAPVRVL